MDMQLVVVGICLLVAVAFMGRKVWRTLRRTGGCGSDCRPSAEVCAACAEAGKLRASMPRPAAEKQH